MNLADLLANDPPAQRTARASVPASARSWGDAEAEAAGLYEPASPKGGELPAGFKLVSESPKASGGLPEGFQLVEETPREKLAAGLRDGKTGNAETYRAASFRTNQGVRPANATDAAINGATMGFGDEASAAARAPIDMALRGEEFGEAYQHNLAAERDRLDQYRKANPKSAMAAEAIGGLAAAPGKASQAATSALRLAGQSGLVGATAGAGNAEGDISDRAVQGAQGGAIGAGIGLAIPGVINATKAVLSPATKNIAAAVNPEGRALDQFAKDLARDKVTPAAARAELAAAETAGQPMTLVDVGGRNVMGLARSVATGKGEGSQQLLNMLDARRMDAPDRVVGSLKNALADPDAFYPTLERIVANRKEVAAPLYEAAYAKAAPETPLIKSILSTPAGQSAIRNAEKLSANEGIEFTTNVRGLDLVKRSLDDMISTAQRGGQNNEVRILSGMKDRLVKEIDRTVPEYKAARQAYSSDFDLEQAVERGRAFLKPGVDAEVAAKEIAAMSSAEREVARIGMAREVKAMFDNPSLTLSKANQLLNSGRLKPILKEMFPSDAAFNAWRADLSREAAMLRRGQKISGGSDTVPKLNEGADVDVAGPARQLFEGRPIAAALSAASQIGGRAAKGVNEKTANRLSEIFTTADPARQAQILDQIEAMLPKGGLTRLLGMTGGRGAPEATQR